MYEKTHLHCEGIRTVPLGTSIKDGVVGIADHPYSPSYSLSYFATEKIPYLRFGYWCIKDEATFSSCFKYCKWHCQVEWVL